MCGVNAKPAKGLCNLLIFNKLQSTAVGKRPRLRRDCDEEALQSIGLHGMGRKETSIKKGLRPSRLKIFFEELSRKETSIKKGLRHFFFVHC